MQSGTSLYLAIIVMIILLAIVLGLTSILLGQMVMVREMGYSVIALSAADAGTEEILVHRESPPIGTGLLVELSNEATYQVSVYRGPEILPGGEAHCDQAGWFYCITSVGTYQGVRRAIEIVY